MTAQTPAAQRKAGTAAAPSDLRERLVAAAAAILSEEGYERLSMRHVAQRAGCSQMAMYRHFANKEALTQYLCVSLYAQFTTDIQRKMGRMTDARQKLHTFVRSLVRFAVKHADQYALLFLVRHPQPSVFELREELGQTFLAEFQTVVRQMLAPGVRRATAERCMRQILCCIHGGAALLLAHPVAYGLTEGRVVEETLAAIHAILAHRPR